MTVVQVNGNNPNPSDDEDLTFVKKIVFETMNHNSSSGSSYWSRIQINITNGAQVAASLRRLLKGEGQPGTGQVNNNNNNNNGVRVVPMKICMHVPFWSAIPLEYIFYLIRAHVNRNANAYFGQEGDYEVESDQFMLELPENSTLSPGLKILHLYLEDY